jgi:hypothetical protein
MLRVREQPTFFKEFCFELAKDSAFLRREYQRDRESWFRGLNLFRKEEQLFELEMALRAIVCFFNLHNQFLGDPDQAITRDFSEELKMLRAVLRRACTLAEQLLGQGASSALNFQSYIENQMAPDFLRLRMLRQTLEQKRPEESLYILSHSLLDCKKLVEHLLKREPSSYSLFFHLGQIITREIAFNRFFNPLSIMEFRPEYDRIRSVEVLDALNALSVSLEHRIAQRIFLSMFRLLHTLRYVKGDGATDNVRRSWMLMTLFYSEVNTLIGYLRVLATKASLRKRWTGIVGAWATEMQDELKRTFGGQMTVLEVRRLADEGGKASINTCRDGWRVLIEGGLSRFLQTISPSGNLELGDKTPSRSQAIRLRADLWLYRRLLERVLEDSKPIQTMEELPPFVLRFHRYFIATSYNLLRYGDGFAFEWLEDVLDVVAKTGFFPRGNPSFEKSLSGFREQVDKLYDQVCRRSDLRDLPPDEGTLSVWLQHWLEGGS